VVKKKVKKKKSRPLRRILIILLFFVIVFGSVYFVAHSMLGKINSVKITDDDDELNIASEVQGKDNGIINVALFGIDAGAKDFSGRADSIMISTLDKKHKLIKFTSIMRDTYVDIPGKQYSKINHSYSYGGAELTIKTINQNFDMNIKDYVTVNFAGLEKIVDAVGGVKLQVTDGEVGYMDDYQRHLDELAGNISKRVQTPGNITLTGRQAVAYCRIRYIGNDQGRTERQRKVLELVVKKVLHNKSLKQTLTLIETLSPYIETSLSKGEMIGLATSVFTSRISEMEDTRIPLDGHWKDGTMNGTYYLKPDTLIENVAYLHKFIYENEEYTPSSTVSRINNKLK